VFFFDQGIRHKWAAGYMAEGKYHPVMSPGAAEQLPGLPDFVAE